jgi:exopolyphosphatase/pppGpp-phosphohydrolase
LGSLTLHQDDEQGIELFEWSNIAITRAGILEQRFNSLIARFHAAEDTIKSLSKQLEKLISSKNEDEQRLMSDFTQLLNEKKLKIRNQQRLLASANVDPEKRKAFILAIL